MKCENCKYRLPKMEMVSPDVSALVDNCRLGKPSFLSGCDKGEPNLRTRISGWYEKFRNSQVTEYEKHINPEDKHYDNEMH